MKSIVFFVRDISDCGGIQQTTCNLINSLLNESTEYKVTVISVYNKRRAFFFDLSSDVERLVLFDYPIDLYKKILTIRKRLEYILNNIVYDLLIIQGAEYANYISREVWKSKVLICEHGYFGFGHTFGFHWRGVRATLRNAYGIVTLTEADADEYRRHLKRNIPVCHIYNSLTSSNKLITPDCDTTKSKIIVSCGSLVKLKGFDIAIKAAAIVLKKYPDWKWYLYGDGVQREKLQALIDELDLSDRFVLKGYETNKDIIYREKAFLVVTSEFEGFGMVFIEAMQYALPLISFDVKYGPKEIVKHGENGFLIKNRNSEDLAKTIDYLISNDKIRRKFSSNSFESLRMYSAEHIAKEWIKLFEVLIINK